MTDAAKAPRVMIVDDTPQNIQVLGATLRRENYQIYVAQNGLQALEMLKEVLPDLILLDVMMPELDGFETCKHLKAQERTRVIPIIFLTAKSETNDIVRGFELGAVDYVTKPFNANELLIRVRTQLELKHNRDEIERISNERKALVHILCHDLANPMSTMLSILNMPDFFASFEEMRELLVSAADNGLNVIQLVREMQALDEHRLNLETHNLLSMITESERMLRTRFSEKNVRLVKNIDADLNIIAERTSFVNSVINNLLTNALKFSYADTEIRLYTEIVDSKMLILHIEDDGIGMSEKLLDGLFDVRKTTSRRGTQGEQGTGFGMPLVQKFIHTYGGDIRVESRSEKEDAEHHGTKISLHLLRSE